MNIMCYWRLDRKLKEKEKYFYSKIANETSKRSYAKRAKVGAVIVKDKNIIGFGFNGTYSGQPNICETDDGTKTLPNVIHAEKNAIMKVCKSNNSTNESSIFITHAPCNECASLIILSGIKDVYYSFSHKSKNFGSGVDLLKSKGIKVYNVVDNNIKEL